MFGHLFSGPDSAGEAESELDQLPEMAGERREHVDVRIIDGRVRVCPVAEVEKALGVHTPGCGERPCPLGDRLAALDLGSNEMEVAAVGEVGALCSRELQMPRDEGVGVGPEAVAEIGIIVSDGRSEDEAAFLEQVVHFVVPASGDREGDVHHELQVLFPKQVLGSKRQRHRCATGRVIRLSEQLGGRLERRDEAVEDELFFT